MDYGHKQSLKHLGAGKLFPVHWPMYWDLGSDSSEIKWKHN